MRDYPAKLLFQKGFQFKGKVFKCHQDEKYFNSELGLEKYYLDLYLTMDTLNIAFGLNLFYGMNEITDWIMKVASTSKKPFGGTDSNLKLKKRHSQEESKFNFWDKVRHRFHGRFFAKCYRKLKLRLLTHVHPFSLDAICLSISNPILTFHKQVEFSTDNWLMKRKPRLNEESHLLKIPRLEIVLKLAWKSKNPQKDHFTDRIDPTGALLINPSDEYKSSDLEVYLYINMPRIKTKDSEAKTEFVVERQSKINFVKGMVKQSNVNFVHLQMEFMVWLMNLPQLRRDVLRTYRLNPSAYSEVADSNADMLPSNEIYSDYLDLIKHSLNAQLNKFHEDINVFKMISKAYVKFHISGARFVYTNYNNPYLPEPNAENPELNAERSSILGVQFVVDSFSFSGTIFQKQVTILASLMKKKKKKSKKKEVKFAESKIWAMKDGFGKLEFAYASVFKGDELADLKPKAFEEYRLKNFRSSLENPITFCEFFNLPVPQNAKKIYSTAADIDNIINNLINETETLELLRNDSMHKDIPSLMTKSPMLSPGISHGSKPVFVLSRISKEWAEESKVETPLPKKTDFKMKPFKFDSLEEQKLEERKNEPQFISTDPGFKKTWKEQRGMNDFEYKNLGIFFKADNLIYEQDKTMKLEDYDPENPNELWEIGHFFTFTGWKLLITFDFTNLLKHLALPQRKQDMSKIYKMQREKGNLFKKNGLKGAKEDSKQREVDILKQNPMARDMIKEIMSRDQKPGSDTTLKEKKHIKYVFNVMQPQFNLHYVNRHSQMILTSRRNCMIIVCDTGLPYDEFKQDLKYTYKVCFRELECFISPRNLEISDNSLWIPYKEEDAHERGYNMREGLLMRIISCDKAIFEYTLFDLDECNVDFSKPLLENVSSIMELSQENSEKNLKEKIISQNKALLWKNEPRIGSLLVNLDSWTSFMDRGSFTVFKDILDFMNILISSNKMRIQEIERQKQKNEELKHVGKANMEKYLQQQSIEKDTIVTRKKSKVEYSINNGSLKLMKDEIPFINFRWEHFVATNLSFLDDSNELRLRIRRIEVENLFEEDIDYKMILTRYEESQTDDDMIQFTNNMFFAPGIANTAHRWKVFEQYEFKISPMVIKLTEDVYKKFYEWAFQDAKKKKVKDKQNLIVPDINKRKKKKSEPDDNSGRKAEAMEKSEKLDIGQLPSFYKYVKIGDIKAEVSFKTGSYFKRMNNIKVSMSPYVKYSKFWTTKKLFDNFEKHVIKQAVGQVFSIVGQKLGFASKELQVADEANEKEIEKKKKLLLGI